VRTFTGAQEMRDLTVAKVHTYYVLVGGEPVLVHNTGPEIPDVPDDGNSLARPILWHAGRPGTETDRQARLPASMRILHGANLAEAHYIFVVLPDRSVHAFNNSAATDANEWHKYGHQSLAGKQPVIMAGTFVTDAQGRIIKYDHHSGHYQPQYNPHNTALRDIADDAFQRHGFVLAPDAKWTDLKGQPSAPPIECS
jgi:hypothetical protein